MSDQEKFLTRWSRRKLAPAEKKAADEAPPAADAPSVESAPPPPKAEAPEFDLSKLPSLDSIGADSDIRAFLQAGVPSALKHAALRRAWSADPAIRDYIGPNENFWEGVGPGGVPGFGDLDPSVDIKKLVAEVFGNAEPTPRTDHSAPAEANVPTPTASESSLTETKKQSAQNSDPLLQRGENAALRHNDPQQETVAAKPRRHGGAMPQ